jgi:hypothetical protein
VKPEDDSLEKKIVAALDAGAADLRAGTVYRLQQARAAALARLAEPERATQIRLTPAFAGTGVATGGSQGRGSIWTRPTFWLSLLFVVAMAIGYQQWRAWQQVAELEDVDTAILTSDLPIDAYLDRGFQNWLKTLTTDGGS